MTVNERKKCLEAQRKRAAELKRKQQQKRIILVSVIVLFLISVTVFLFFILKPSASPDDILADSSILQQSTPTPAPTNVPFYISRANITSSSSAFEDFLPVYHDVKTDTRMLAITVDDCFQKANLLEIINIARQYNVKLTLFPIGNQVSDPKLQEALNLAFSYGFQIENHTMNHSQVYTLSNEDLYHAILDQQKIVSDALNIDYQMHFVRLPGGNGEEDPRVHFYMNLLGYKGIADWYYSGSDASIYYIKKRMEPGSIYLFHTQDEDVQKLKEFIPYALQQGYKLVTLNELLGLQENTAYPKDSVPVPEFVPYIYDEYVVMKNGDRSYCVRLLQQRLLELGYLPASTKLDGIFGEQTAQALKNFQSVHGLSIIGTGNLETQSILFSEQAVPNTLQ